VARAAPYLTVEAEYR